MSDDIQENIIVTNDEVTLVELFTVLWKKKILITGISLIFAVSSVYYSLSLPNIYLSDVVFKSCRH